MDDGIILNIEDSPSQRKIPAKKAKGGRWTDRVKARRTLKRKSTTELPHDTQTESTELDESPRPVKKKARKAVSNRQEDPRQTISTKPAKSTPAWHPQVVSSLFTSNPEVHVEEIRESPKRSTKPSNAPLTDKSTFAGLGLDPLIVTHLSSKMNVATPTSIQREALPPLLSPSSEDVSERDVFIQSQTGSGKTLAYLLPILQDLLPLSCLSYIDRSIGTLAIIIAPTRELAKQISDVLEQILSLRLRPPEEGADDTAPSSRLTRWLVSGPLIGGENRTHEKARLRKGLPILVCTPGRLLDHLQSTSSFNVGKCRWLVLDEADRLMDLGFEEPIKKILQALDGRRKLAVQAFEEGKSLEVGGWDWKRRRRTILCSATIQENVQHLAGTALVRPIIVKSLENVKPAGAAVSVDKTGVASSGENFTPPSQLLQKYVIVPLKLRLVTLVAVLRSLLVQGQGRHGARIIVFLSCTDSVDYHWRLLGNSSIGESNEDPDEGKDSEDAADSENSKDGTKKDGSEKIALTSPLLPGTSIYRLHGSLPHQMRQASLKGFADSRTRSNVPKTGNKSSSVLLCTSVASRGLDLPLVRAVVQYDLPTEGGATEYVHRVGRTARVGKGGEAWSLVAPSEQEWLHWIEERMRDKASDGKKKTALVPASVETVLRAGFGGKGSEFEERATQVQLAFERWVLKDNEHGELARKAFLSHLRAYATHPSDEKHMFHIRNLHLGHLAKAFGLREAPGNITQKGSEKHARAKTSNKMHRGDTKATLQGKKGRSNGHDNEHDMTAEARMREVVRRQGKLVKKGGILMATGADEFQVAGGNDLKKFVGS